MSQPYRKKSAERLTIAEWFAILLLAAGVAVSIYAFLMQVPGVHYDPTSDLLQQVAEGCQAHGYYDTGTVRITCRVTE